MNKHNVFYVKYVIRYDEWLVEKECEFDTEDQMMDFVEIMSEDNRIMRLRTSKHFDSWKSFYLGDIC